MSEPENPGPDAKPVVAETDPEEIRDFIVTYSAASEQRIRFEWNGGHGEQFDDSNMSFREGVREVVFGEPSSAPITLIRDLFRAETRFSREAWEIADEMGVIAEELLRRGGVDFLDDFLEGKFQSFDASLGTAFDVDLTLATSMLTEVRRRLRMSPDSPLTELWLAGEKLFVDWLANCHSKPE